MPSEALRQLAKTIAGTSPNTQVRPAAPLTLTRGVVSGVAVTSGSTTTITIQLAGSSTDTPADVVGGFNPSPGDVVEVLVAPPRVIVLGTSGPVPVPPRGGYLSLTGPGETATPGDLTQAGGLTVYAAAGDTMGIILATGIATVSPHMPDPAGDIQLVDGTSDGLFVQAISDGGIFIQDTPYLGPGNASGGIQLYEWGDGGISALDTGGGGILIDSTGNIDIAGSGGTELFLDGSAQRALLQSSLTVDIEIAGGAHTKFSMDYTAGTVLKNGLGAGMVIETVGGGPMTIQNGGTGVMVINDASSYGLTIETTPNMTTGNILIQTVGLADIALNANGGGAGGGDIALTARSIELDALLIGFFGGSANPQPTVTGSRGGNAALASLLAGLNSLSLVVDSSTP